MLQVKKNLFSTDLLGCSKKDLPCADKLAQEHGDELHLMQAIVLHDDPHNAAHHFPDPSRIPAMLEELATERMSTLIGDQDVADLMVMGTHGREGKKHVLLGGTAEKVIAAAECPTLTVKGSGESQP